MLSFPYILSHQAPATRRRHRHRKPSKEGTVVEKRKARHIKTKVRRVAEGKLHFKCSSQLPCPGKRRIQTTSFTYIKQTVFLRKSVSLRKIEKRTGEELRRGVWNKFVHCSGLFIIAAIRRKASRQRAEYTKVPLDDTLIATTDDFLLLELVPLVALELEAEPDAEGLLETVTCPEISEKKDT